MYNPFIQLSPELMAALLRVPKIFVRQHYPRGILENNGRVPLLLTYYYKDHHIELSRARLHMKQLAADRYRFMYDSEDEDHRKKLELAALQPEGYSIYVNLSLRKWEPSHALRKQVHDYMLRTFPAWRFDMQQKLKIRLQDLYGKFYLELSWQGNKAEVLLDEVEKC